MDSPSWMDRQLDNITLQLQEMEMIEAMFPGDNEVTWHDPSLLVDAEQYKESNGNSPRDLRYLTFELNFKAPINSTDDQPESELTLKLSVTLPSMYPEVRPELSIISDAMKRTDQTALKTALDDFVNNLQKDEMILLDIITWLQENASTFYSNSTDQLYLENNRIIADHSSSDANSDTMTSLWLYMHHIYSKTKRKDIQHWARELGLTGFSLPGKPGVVYVEGVTAHIEDYFDRLRSLPWKRITCKIKESCPKRVFKDFEELCFDVHGAHNYHMDLGQFYEFLSKNNLGHIFKELFGVEGQVKVV